MYIQEGMFEHVWDVGTFSVSGPCLWIVNFIVDSPPIGDLSDPVTKNKKAFFFSKSSSYKISHKHLTIYVYYWYPSYFTVFFNSPRFTTYKPQIIFYNSSALNSLIMLPVTTLKNPFLKELNWTDIWVSTKYLE